MFDCSQALDCILQSRKVLFWPGQFPGLFKKLVERVRGKRFDQAIGKVGEMLRMKGGINKGKVSKRCL